MDRLHRHDCQRDGRLEGEVARVATAHLDRQVGGAALELRCELLVALERDDLMSGERERQRDAAGAGADVQDGPRRA
jgi:hypothetical protein